MGKRSNKKRAPNGSGSVWQRKDGRYSAALSYPYYDPETGRSKRKRVSTTKADWKDAHNWLVGMKSELLGGKVMSPDDPLVSQFLDEWLTEVVEPDVSRNTYLKREYYVRVHLKPAFGASRLKDLQPRRIHSLYTRLAREDYSLATRRDAHTTLKMALKQAVKWGLIPQSPADLVDAPRAGARDVDIETEVRALTDEQARILFAATEGYRWHNYYVAAVRTGLRPGEMLALQWGDLSLDTDPGSLRVRRSLDRKEGGGTYFKAPKTPASRRTLALHWEATDALVAQKEVLKGEGLGADGKALVFPNKLGKAMNRDNLRNRHLKPDLARAELPVLTLHELRHTFASIMLHEWHVPSAVVQQMLGHDSITMTMDLYGHLMPDAQTQAIQALRTLHNRPKTGT